MRKIVFAAALAALSQLAQASGRNEHAIYVGGSAELAKDTEGTLALDNAKKLSFVYATGAFEIPYERVTRLQIADKPEKRKKHQLLTVSFKDDNGTGQAATFELPNLLVPDVMPVIEARTGKRAHAQLDREPDEPVELVPVTISSKPSGGFVSFWGQTAGKTPVTTKLAPGTYTVTVEADGMLPWTHDIVVEPGKPMSVLAELAQPVKVTVAER
ncbi:MAG TPA: PEGA domain-containing protein [Bryobacteraceae bacterium]|nr:PEGA domain-containing protein [Bryobacteraceae bacterium]